MAAEQAKDRGNKAFTAGSYSEAIACFTEAIALHEKATGRGEKPEGSLHVYYSNRSASYLKLGNAQNALLDAEKCVSLQRGWVRGYSRKGAALFQLGRFPDAYRAYKDGLAIDPSNKALVDGLHLVEQRMVASASSGGPQTSTTSSAPSGGAPAQSVKQFVMGSKAQMFQFFQFVIRSLMVLNFLLYALPLVIPAHLAYATFFKLALFNHISFLVYTHGMPKFQAAYAQRLVLDPTTQSFFSCLIFFVSSPYSLAMLPTMLVELVHFSAYLANLLRVVGLAHVGAVQMMTSKLAIPAASYILGDATFATLPAQSKWAKLYHRIPQVAANVEVGIGVFMILELLTPARNFFLVILYWQLLRVRYMISPQLQEAFRMLNATILRVTTHPRCPQIVGTLYAKIQALASRMTDMSQAQAAAAGGPRSRCSIM